MTVWRLRLASPGLRYPLPIDGAVIWYRDGEPVTVPLPPVPPGHVIAASFASTDVAARFSFRLTAGRPGEERRHHATTARFGRLAWRREHAGCPGVTVPVDYFETTEALPAPELTLLCASAPPRDYLIVVSMRPKEMTPPSAPPTPAATVVASSLSQRALPPPLSRSACGPTATAMALGVHTLKGLRAFASLARHRPTGLYGAWPQNLWAAARHGRLGGLELAADWDIAEQALAAGSPVVASIRFGAGGLAGAPLEATGGHLVLLRGIGDGDVLVHDPAAPPASVVRRYDAAEFAAAWLRWRGVAYMFAATGSDDDW